MMSRIFKFMLWLVLIILLTIISQIGGIILIASILIAKFWNKQFKAKTFIIFLALYILSTYLIFPFLAPIFGREKVKHSENIKPATYFTVLSNRNYVIPEVNSVLSQTAKRLNNTEIQLVYLDANFPLLNGFPLFPHLSHNDGKKIDLCLIYQNSSGEIISKPKSLTGYGIFVNPEQGEIDQNEQCKKEGFYQYDFPKYLSFGELNSDLVFSEDGTKKLINALLKNDELEKIFIEPHLKKRMGLTNSKVRFQGCHSVRHDDHIHLQLK